MKTILQNSIIAIFAIATTATHAFSQCTPDPLVKSSGVFPTSFAFAYPTVAYNQVMTFFIPKDTATVYLGVPVSVVINTYTVKSITGLPAGITYAFNVSNATYNGGTSGCVQFWGTPTTMGVYPLVANLEINGVAKTPLGDIPRTDTASNRSVSMYVFGTVGQFEMLEAGKTSIKYYPNPTTNLLNLEITRDKASELEIEIFDLKGSLIKAQSAKADAGKSVLSVDVSQFSKGTYLIKTTGSGEMFTSKFNKQ